MCVSATIPVRVSLLLWLIQAKMGLWTIEQPATSLAHRHPRFREVVSLVRVWRVGFWLGRYGARSPKRLRVWSNSSGIGAFRTTPMTKKDRDRLPDRLAVSGVNAQGKKVFSGKQKLLKQSQPCSQLFLSNMQVHGLPILFVYLCMPAPGAIRQALAESTRGCLPKAFSKKDGDHPVASIRLCFIACNDYTACVCVLLQTLSAALLHSALGRMVACLLHLQQVAGSFWDDMMEEMRKDPWEDARMQEVVDYLYHNKRCAKPEWPVVPPA